MANKGGRVFNIFNCSLLAIVAIITLYPFWYVLMYSISDPAKISLHGLFLVPQGFDISTYKYIVVHPLIIMGFKNSLIVTAAGTSLSLLLTGLSAYPLSRERLVGKKYIFGMMFFTMLFSGGLIPTFLVVRTLHMVDTFWSLFVPGSISVYNMLIMIKFFKGIPISLIESAKIDGYSDFAIFVKIVLPLSRAVFASIGLFSAVGYWNMYLPSLIYITDPKKRVMQVILQSMLQEERLIKEMGILTEWVTPQNIKFAAVIVTVFPILCVYPYIQKHFTKGVLIGSVKG